MNPIALAALKKSIKHWERLACGNPRPGERANAQSCALCGLFLKPTNVGGVVRWCNGCPVKAKTGRDCCDLTPYARASRLFDAFNPRRNRFLEAAKDELAFLKSLLPKTKKKGRKK